MSETTDRDTLQSVLTDLVVAGPWATQEGERGTYEECRFCGAYWGLESNYLTGPLDLVQHPHEPDCLWPRIEAAAREGDNLRALCRRVVLAASPFISAWEMDPYDDEVDGEQLHRELREAIGMSEDEWQAARR